jgi:TP53 regulating kinase and related kinases
MMNQVIYRGAEAEIRIASHLGREVVQKRRLPKHYRLPEIDQALISYRTREESKLIAEARTAGVSVPVIYDVDLAGGIITMEYIKGRRIKDILNALPDDERKALCILIGKSIAMLHNHDIIHGDITTSNMILADGRVSFIDFGLGSKTIDLEAKGVDLHVLMEAFESTHSQRPTCFEDVFEGYRQAFQGDASQVWQKIEDIVKRGRYR